MPSTLSLVQIETLLTDPWTFLHDWRPVQVPMIFEEPERVVLMAVGGTSGAVIQGSPSPTCSMLMLPAPTWQIAPRSPRISGRFSTTRPPSARRRSTVPRLVRARADPIVSDRIDPLSVGSE